MLPDELERTVARRVPGEGPVDLHRLSEGRVNATYRAVRAGRAYSVRVPASRQCALGLDRSWESRVLECAASADLAPAVEYCDPHRGVLISRWVDGRPWSTDDALQRSGISRMAGLMRRIHALRIPARPRLMSPMQWIDHYSAAADAGASRASDQLRRLRTAAALRVAALTELPAPQRVLCHSDLHRLNLIDRGNSLVLLDWEYAHVVDSFWDLASWSGNNDFEDAAKLELLTDYLRRPPTSDDEVRLALLGWLYDYVCLLWRQLDGGPDTRAPDERRADEHRAKKMLARLVATAGSRARQVPAD